MELWFHLVRFNSALPVDLLQPKTFKIKKSFKIGLNHNIKYNLFIGSTSGRFYQKITGVGPNLGESGYDTGECGTESRCIQMCENSADCGAAVWKVDTEEGCAPEQRKCRNVKMISPNVIDDSDFLHGINVDLYLKDGVWGKIYCTYQYKLLYTI